MEVLPLRLQGLLLLRPKVFEDDRGFFFESFQQKRYNDAGIAIHFAQDNHSYSTKGTLRGMHFQSTPGQAKLVRAGLGTIWDVVVDMRPESPTFGEWEGVTLDGKKHEQLFVPVGFAHGFCVLSDEAHVFYKVSTPYVAETEKGFRWDDPEIGIQWPIERPNLSERDKQAPSFQEVMSLR